MLVIPFTAMVHHRPDDSNVDCHFEKGGFGQFVVLASSIRVVELVRVQAESLTTSATLAISSNSYAFPAAPHFSFMKRSPCVYTSSGLGNKSRHTLVAAASAGKARPNASITIQPSYF